MYVGTTLVWMCVPVNLLYNELQRKKGIKKIGDTYDIHVCDN